MRRQGSIHSVKGSVSRVHRVFPDTYAARPDPFTPLRLDASAGRSHARAAGRRDGRRDAGRAVRSPPGRAPAGATDDPRPPYPRGWLYAGAVPVVLLADHANIHLWIAASTTALAVAPGGDAGAGLASLWAVALLGAAATLARPIRSRWWRIAANALAGYLAAAALAAYPVPAGGLVGVLVAAGGASYAVGGLVYGLRFPDPSPRWYGYHEVFHALTIVGFGAHAAAIWLPLAS